MNACFDRFILRQVSGTEVLDAAKTVRDCAYSTQGKGHATPNHRIVQRLERLIRESSLSEDSESRPVTERNGAYLRVREALDRLLRTARELEELGYKRRTSNSQFGRSGMGFANEPPFASTLDSRPSFATYKTAQLIGQTARSLERMPSRVRADFARARLMPQVGGEQIALGCAGAAVAGPGALLLAGAGAFIANWAVFNTTSLGLTNLYRNITNQEMMSVDEIRLHAATSFIMFGAIGAAGRVLGPALELILPRVLSRYATVVAGIMLGNHIDTCAGLTQADPREFGVQLFHTALAAIPMEFMAHGATAATRPVLLRGNASIYERAARRGWINESDAAPFIAGAREMIEAQNQAIQRGLRNAGRFLKLMVAAPALLAFGAVPGGGGGSGSGGGEYEVPITRGSDRGQRVDGMIERVRKNQAQSEGRLPLTADESYVQPPDTRQLLVEMVVPEGMSSEALQQALSRLAGATGSSALEQALEGISFRRLSGPFESDAIEMRPRTDAEGIFDIIPQGENAPRYSEHVVPVDAAIQNPTLLGQVRQLLIPNAVGPFKNALEYCEARRANRPILGGVADPTSEQLVRHQQVAARRSLLWRLADLYYRPRSFERSNRLYESLGVSLFRRVVVGFVTELPPQESSKKWLKRRQGKGCGVLLRRNMCPCIFKDDA